MYQNLRKIVVIGISGTGKSSFARKLADKTHIKLYHMDSIIWSQNWVETEQNIIIQKLTEIATTDKWIVEGWIDTYSKNILEQADAIFYLDYPGWLAAWGGIQRWWQYRGKQRLEMPEGCNETFSFNFLMTMFLRKERPHIESVLENLNVKNLVRVQSRHAMKSILHGFPLSRE